MVVELKGIIHHHGSILESSDHLSIECEFVFFSHIFQYIRLS